MNRPLIATLCLLAGSFASGVLADLTASCVDLRNRSAELIKAADVRSLERHHERLNAAGCRRVDIRYVAQVQSNLLAQRADKAVKAGQLKEAAVLLGRTLAMTWLKSAVLGDLEAEKGLSSEVGGEKARIHWQRAFDAYNQAFAIAEEDDAVPASIQKLLHQKAIEAELLSGTLIQGISRDGVPKGIYKGSKKFSVRSQLMPIQFVFDSTEFTLGGEVSAQVLARYCLRQGFSAVELVGHTDQVGGEAYNQALSERRAAKVREFLKRQGVTASIATRGVGKTEPMVLSRSDYSPAQVDQMNRRVEFKGTP